MTLIVPVSGTRRDQRSAIPSLCQRVLKYFQVIAVPPVVCIKPGNPGAAAFTQTRVDRGSEPPVFCQSDDPKFMLVAKFLQNSPGVVCTTVIYNDYFVRLTRLRENRA
jgi:hypothetical protein